MIFDNLPTARQKKRKIKKDFDKRLLAVDREYDKVRQQICELGYEELEIPYQRGWKRSFILRDDVKRSTRAAFFEGILEKINTVHHSTRKDFKKKRRRRGRSGYIVRPQELKKPGLYEFVKMKFTEEEACWFQAEEYWCPLSKCWRMQYVFREPWRFVLKTEPNMITHRKRYDLELEQRKAELSRILDAYSARFRLDWLSGYSNKWWYSHPGWRDSNPFKNKQKDQIVAQLFEMEYVAPDDVLFELF